MVKTLSPIGNSLGIIVEKAILDLLDITRDTELKVETDGEALIFRPVRPRSAKASARRMMEIHADTLAKLAQ